MLFMTEQMTTENALENAITEYKTLAGQIKNLQEQQKTHKAVIEEIFVEIGVDKADTKAGKAYITAPSVTISYDAKALDALCASDDQINRLLSPHRKESQRAGTLTIR
jgi:hypothetical protein